MTVVKKKAATKKRTGKKKVAASRLPSPEPGGERVQQSLNPDWEDDVPEDLKTASDEYLKAMRAHIKLAEKKKAAMKRALELMEAHGIFKLRIDEGRQWLTRSESRALVTTKVVTEKDDTRKTAAA